MDGCARCGYELDNTWRYCGRCGWSRPAVPDGETAARPSLVARHARTGTPPDRPRLPTMMTRLRRSDQAVAIGVFVLAVSLFLPWFGFAFGGSLSGFGAHGWLFLILLACAGVLGYLVSVAVRPGTTLAPAHWQGLITATGFSAFLTVIALLDSPTGASLRLGAILALGGALTSLAGAITTRQTLVRSAASDVSSQGMNLITATVRLLGRIRTAVEGSPAPAPAPLPDARPPYRPQAEATAGPAWRTGPAEAQVTRPTSQGRSGSPAPPAADDSNKTPRGAVITVGWGGSLALLGWGIWMVSVWGSSHPAGAGLRCTIGQSVPGYGTCTPALQQVLGDLTSASNSFASQVLPNYHLGLAGTGIAVAIALLTLLYVFTLLRNQMFAVIVLGMTAVLAAIGALMVGSIVQVGSSILTANHTCEAAGVGPCISGSAVTALLSGWIAVGGGGLALLGGLFFARSLTASRRTATAAAGAQPGMPTIVRAAETTRPSTVATLYPVRTVSSSLPDEAAARACDWCHAPAAADDRFCSECGRQVGRGGGLR